MMDWLIQSGAALLAFVVALIAMGFLVHMSFSSRPDARMAFLTGLMKGAMLDGASQNARSANPRVHRRLAGISEPGGDQGEGGSPYRRRGRE